MVIGQTCKNKTLLVQAGTFLCFQAGCSSAMSSSAIRSTVVEYTFVIKQIHTFTSNMLLEQRRFGLGSPSLYQVKWPFDLIKAGATQTETSLLQQYVAGECVDLLDDYDFPGRTITDTHLSFSLFLSSVACVWQTFLSKQSLLSLKQSTMRQ